MSNSIYKTVWRHATPEITQLYSQGKKFKVAEDGTVTLLSSNSPRQLTICNVLYKDGLEASEKLGIPVSCIYRALEKANSRVLDEIPTPTICNNESKYVIDGIEYNGISEASKSLNVPVLHLLKKQRAAGERTFNMGIDRRHRPVTIDGVKYRSAKQAHRVTGINYTKVIGLAHQQKLDNQKITRQLLKTDNIN